jgi:glucose/arabinose dehydrogenase
MKIRLSVVLLLAAACRGEADPPVTNATLRHYEIRADALPKPFASSSAGNPPRVSARTIAPAVPPGFRTNVFASNLDDPRNMILASNGDVLLAESGEGKVLVLRDTNHDGVSDQQFTLVQGLSYPYGLALRGDALYIGNDNAVVRVPYRAGQTSSPVAPQRVVALPSGGHSTRNVAFNRDGSKMYVAIGSESNVGREGPPRAAVMEYNADGSGARVYAYGLRNPIGLAWNAQTNALWTSVNERDGLGDDLVPDYITELRAGGFYGWPYAYIGANEEPRRAGERRDLVAKSIVPSVLIQAHSAPIAVVFYNGAMFPPEYRGNAFVALHGSWNREKRTGYKVIRVAFKDGKPAGGYDDFATGWMTDENARAVSGRPAGLLVLADGSLLISDDGAGVIYRVSSAR